MQGSQIDKKVLIFWQQVTSFKWNVKCSCRLSEFQQTTSDQKFFWHKRRKKCRKLNRCTFPEWQFSSTSTDSIKCRKVIYWSWWKRFLIGQTRTLLCLFLFFSKNILKQNCRLQQNSNTDLKAMTTTMAQVAGCFW